MRATGAVASIIYPKAAPFILQINAGNSNKQTNSSSCYWSLGIAARRMVGEAAKDKCSLEKESAGAGGVSSFW